MEPPEHDRDRAGRLAFAVVFALVVPLVLLALLPPVGEADLWFHLATGDWILREGGLPRDEPWAHTVPHGRAEVVHGWLADIGLASVRTGLGYGGLRLLVPLVLLPALVAHGLLLRRQGFAVPLAAALPFLLLALYADRLRLRPDLLAFLLFPLFAWTLAAWHEAGRLACRAGLLCLGLVLLWANLHPTCALAPVLAGGLWLGADRSLRGLALPALIGLATLANPYGIGTWLYILENEQVARFVDEWAASWAYFGVGPTRWAMALAPWLALGLCAAGWREATKDPGPRAWTLASLAATLVALLKARYLFLTFVPLAFSTPPAWRRPARPWIAGTIVLVAAGVQLFVARRELLVLTLRAPGRSLLPGYPAETAAFLARLPRPIKLWHPTPWGGYLADRAGGKARTFVDGRVPLFGEEVLAEQERLTGPGTTRAEVEAVFAARGVEGLVVVRGSWRAGAEWVHVHASPEADLFIHAGRAPDLVEAARQLAR